MSVPRKYKLLSDHYTSDQGKLIKWEAGKLISLSPKQARSLINKIEPVKESKIEKPVSIKES